MGIDFHPYSKKFPQIFTKKREKIKSVFEDCEIHHIGSTAVPGLGGKGIVDIMIAIDSWEKEQELLESLKKLGYTHIHKKRNGRRFLSKNPRNISKGSVHLHITKIGNEEYAKLLSFRDYLRNNPDKAKEYAQIKRKLAGKDSEKYNKEKEKFFEKSIIINNGKITYSHQK